MRFTSIGCLIGILSGVHTVLALPQLNNTTSGPSGNITASSATAISNSPLGTSSAPGCYTDFILDIYRLRIIYGETTGSEYSYCSTLFESEFDSWYVAQGPWTPTTTQTAQFNWGTASYSRDEPVITATFCANSRSSRPQDWGYAYASPCCGRCTMSGPDNVQVYLWEPSPTSAPELPANTFVDSFGFTFTSPSIYLAYSKLFVSDQCSQLGIVGATTLGFAPSEISSVAFYGPNVVATFPFAYQSRITQSHFESVTYKVGNGTLTSLNPTSVLMCNRNVTYGSTVISNVVHSYGIDNCFPKLRAAGLASRINPAWANCVMDAEGDFDPPHILTPMGSMTPAHTTAADPGPQGGSSASAQADPQSSEVSRLLPPKTSVTSPASSLLLSQAPSASAGIRLSTGAFPDPSIVATIASVSVPSLSAITSVGQDPATQISYLQTGNSQSVNGISAQQTVDPNAAQEPNDALSNTLSSIATSSPPKSDAAIQSMADSLLKPGHENKDPAVQAPVVSGVSEIDTPTTPSKAPTNVPLSSQTTGINDPVSKPGSSQPDPYDPNQSFTSPVPPLATALSKGVISLDFHSLAIIPTAITYHASDPSMKAVPVTSSRSSVSPHYSPIPDIVPSSAVGGPSAIIIASQTLTRGGSALTISNTPISYGTNGLVLGAHTIPLTAVSTGPQPVPTTIAGHTNLPITLSNALIVDGATLNTDRTITISNTPIYYGSNGLVIGTRTMSLDASSLLPTTISGHTILPASSSDALIVDGTTLNAGDASTISGTPISYGTNGLIIGSQTIILTAVPFLRNPTTIAGHTFLPASSSGALLIDGAILSAGDVTTISGTVISLDASGDLIVGSSTLHPGNSAGYEVTSSGNMGLGEMIMSAFQVAPPPAVSTTAASVYNTATNPASIPSSSTNASSLQHLTNGSSKRGHPVMRWIWFMSCWVALTVCIYLERVL